MLKQTKEVIEKIIQREEIRVRGFTKNLAEFGDDGDKMDDPLMHSLREDQDRAKYKIGDLRDVLRYPVFNAAAINESCWSEKVGLYSNVNLGITYAEDGYNEVWLTIVDPSDAEYLCYWESFHDFFDGEGFVMASINSPIVQIILGHITGDTLVSEEGPFTSIKILQTEISELLNIGDAISQEVSY